MKRHSVLPLLMFVIITSFSQAAFAIDAARYVVYAADSQTIDTKKDHYSVSFLHGWISSKDGFFKSLFSNKKDGIFQLSAQNTFFDGEMTSVEQITQFLDLASNTNRPVGQAIQIYERVSGDTNTRITFKLALNRDDTIGNVIKAIESTKAELPSDVFSAPWIGYSKAVSSIAKQLLGTNKSNYPFYWVGDIKVNDVVNSNGLMKEHFIVLISPQKDGDKAFANFQASKMAYSATDQRLTYDGNKFTDWSYVVIKVAKAEPYSIEQLAFESNAPWAVLARSQFLTLPVTSIEDNQQLKSVSQNVVIQLKSQIDLLNKEHRFSKYDRALTLKNYANISRQVLSEKCGALNIAVAQCPLGELDQFSKNIENYFGLSVAPKLGERLNADAAALSQRINANVMRLNTIK